jgi:hypothetical protein
MNINLKTLSSNEKKRLYSELNSEFKNKEKEKEYTNKFPQFSHTINSLNFIKLELISNFNKNEETINNLKCNKLNLENSDNTIKSLIGHNKKIQDSINTIDVQIFKIKFEFQNICIHKWVTYYKYSLIKNIDNNDQSYINCNESDINEIKKTFNTLENFNLNDWKKKLEIKNFNRYECYDRETYYKCKNCDFCHTISFYSK